jgi:hypothetical protein
LYAMLCLFLKALYRTHANVIAVEQLRLSQHHLQTKLPLFRSTVTTCGHDRDSMTLLSRSRPKLLSSTRASSASLR